MEDKGIKRMLRGMLVGISCFAAAHGWAADTIHVETAGTLSTLIENSGRQLKLTGFITLFEFE